MKLILAIIAIILLPAANALAGAAVRNISVPTLSEWGMIAAFVILGIVGFIALRKRLAANSGR